MLDKRVTQLIEQAGPCRADLWVLVPAFVAGFLTHGVMLVNKFSFHDDIYQLFAPGQTFIAGRWFLGVLAKAESVLFGTTTLSLPLWNGLLGIVLLAAAAAVLARLYDLRSRIGRILCGCAMVVMPSVVSMMGFMFTIQYYALGFLLASLGASLLARCIRWREILAGIACIVVALGIYQAALPLVCAAMVLYFMQDVLQNTCSPAIFVKRAMCYLLEVGTAVAIYGILALIGMRTFGGSTFTTDYAGLSDVGHTGIGTYLSRIALAYREFFYPTEDAIYCQYPAGMRILYFLVLVLLAILIVSRAVRVMRKGRLVSASQYLLLAAILPLSMNLVLVMTEVKWVHAITVYAQVMLFYLLVTECEAARGGIVRAAALACGVWMIISYIRYGNLCYLKAQFLVSEATSYFDRLIARIQSIPGYEPDMPIVYLSEQDKQADTLYDMAEFHDVITPPYHYDTLINDYAWKEYMRYFNNFDPIVYPENTEGELPADIQAMPRYPADGSIKVEEPGYVVVKF